MAAYDFRKVECFQAPVNRTKQSKQQNLQTNELRNELTVWKGKSCWLNANMLIKPIGDAQDVINYSFVNGCLTGNSCDLLSEKFVTMKLT